MKKILLVSLFGLLGVNSLWADLSLGLSEYQSVVYANRIYYSLFDGIGINVEYDFLDSEIRPVAGFEAAFYGSGVELTGKAGGIYDFYNNNRYKLSTELKYRIGINFSPIHGCEWLICYDYHLSDSKSLYIKSGLEYRYYDTFDGLNFIDVPLQLGIKFKNK